MNHRTLISNARVVLPQEVAKTNVLIEGGKIVAVDADAGTSADEIIDATGLVLMPGVIDDQVHFREPGATHKEDLQSGSTACAAGGITTFLEMPNTSPPATSVELLRWKYQRASQVSRVNYGFYIGATPNNIPELQRADFSPGIKIFIGSSTGDLLVDDQAALESIFAETTLPICAHCEDETTVNANRLALGKNLNVADHSRIRDVNAAVVATRRAISLAIKNQHRFHVLHVSTADELPIIAAGYPWVTAEVCPHHLFFSTLDYNRLGSLVQMNPSVKPPEHPPRLWQALLNGDIQVIATDHAPHLLSEKEQSYPMSPSGIPAVENSLALILNQVNLGNCALEQVAHWMSDAPARIWGLVGKGRIESGYDADLVLVDMHQERTIDNARQLARCGWSPWHGVSLRGWPVRTLVGGKTVYANGKVMTSSRGNAVQCDHSRGGYWKTPDGIGPA